MPRLRAALLSAAVLVGCGSSESADTKIDTNSRATANEDTPGSVTSADGTSRAGADERAMAATVLRFGAAIRAKDPALACRTFSVALKRDLVASLEAQGNPSAKASCAKQVRPVLNLYTRSKAGVATASIMSARVDGDRGKVVFRSADGKAWSLPLIREGASWRLSSASSQPAQ